MSKVLLLLCLIFGACGLTTTRPKLDMSYAQASFLAAKEAKAEVYAASSYRKAEIYYLKAKSAYRRKYFNKAAKDKEFMFEKTPANCLRIDFMKSIFPDAKFIFIERNKVDVIKSMVNKWRYEIDSNTTKIYNVGSHKIRHFQSQLIRLKNAPLID